jgi:hypothetical protein
LVVSGVLAVGADKMVGSVTVSAVMAVAGFGIGWVLARAALRSHLRLFARELGTGPGAASQFGPQRLRVDAAGVSQTGPTAQHEHAWRAVLGLTETADHMFLLIGGGSAYVIPKRAFDSATAIDAFRAAVSEHSSKAE